MGVTTRSNRRICRLFDTFDPAIAGFSGRASCSTLGVERSTGTCLVHQYRPPAPTSPDNAHRRETAPDVARQTAARSGRVRNGERAPNPAAHSRKNGLVVAAPLNGRQG